PAADWVDVVTLTVDRTAGAKQIRFLSQVTCDGAFSMRVREAGATVAGSERSYPGAREDKVLPSVRGAGIGTAGVVTVKLQVKADGGQRVFSQMTFSATVLKK
ncbi:MAG: hypothetical protein AAFU61_02450, partial [Pseudomonadota bacterium]